MSRSLSTELISSAICVLGRERYLQHTAIRVNRPHCSRARKPRPYGNLWFNKRKFILQTKQNASEAKLIHNKAQKIGELTLIYDENLEFIDQQWQMSADFIRV